MVDQSKTKTQLLDEINELRQQVTEHERTETQLRKLFLAVEQSPTSIVITDKDGVIEYVNPQFSKLTGYTSDDVMGKKPNILKSGYTTDEEYALMWKTIKSGKEWRGEFRNKKKNGDHYWEAASISPVFDLSMNITHFVAVKEDITERMESEGEILRISEEENQRREELEKLREISQSMRQAERSSSLLEVFTREVQEFCNADIVASILYKVPDEPVYCYAPDGHSQLSKKQKDEIVTFLLEVKEANSTATIPGFASIFALPLQSSEASHGVVMVASREKDQFKPDEQNMLNAIADMAGTALHRIDILETLEERIQRRTHDLVVLYNLITIISENWRLQDILELSLVLTLETVQADRAIIYLADGKDSPNLKPVIQRGFGGGFQVETANLPDDDDARNVFDQHKALAMNNLAGNPAYTKFSDLKSYAGIPILARGEVRGVFSLFANEEDVFGTDEMALLASIADHLGIGIENSILWEQSRENAAIEERNRLARNLHDSVSQLLYSLTLMAGTTKKMLEHDPDMDAVKNSVERFGDTSYQALKEMRLLLYELRPAVLDSEGLISALQHRIETVEARLGVKVDLDAKELPDLPSNIEDALYHIALEALNNIVKHSESTIASIQFNVESGNVVMEVSDDGVGFDTSQARKGLGLRNMRERGQMLGGEVVIDSEPGGGTRVTSQVKIPSESLIGS